MLAAINTSEAIISCSPPCSPACPCPIHGKWGERIQISSGTLAMRLIVMELGRFIQFGQNRVRSQKLPDTDILPHWNPGCLQIGERRDPSPICKPVLSARRTYPAAWSYRPPGQSPACKPRFYCSHHATWHTPL